MQTLIVKTDIANHAVQAINLLKKLPYIISEIAKKTIVASEPLRNTDWVLPGEPVTDEEMEHFVNAMDNDGSGDDSEIVFNCIKKGLKKGR